MYDDPDLLGHVYAGPYLALEPDFALVVEDDGGVAGYTLGAPDTRQFISAWRERWLPRLARNYPPPTQPDDAPDDRARWLLHHPERMDRGDVLDRYPSHLHIDLLPRAQGRGLGRALLTALLARLGDVGSPGVHLGVHPDNERAITFYRKLGFVDLDGAGLMGRGLPAA